MVSRVADAPGRPVAVTVDGDRVAGRTGPALRWGIVGWPSPGSEDDERSQPRLGADEQAGRELGAERVAALGRAEHVPAPQ